MAEDLFFQNLQIMENQIFAFAFYKEIRENTILFIKIYQIT